VTITPCKGYGQCTRRAPRWTHALDPPQNPPAADLLRRQRRLSLPGAGLRRAAVRTGLAERRGLASDHQRRDRVRRVAAPLAAAPGCGPRRPASGRRPRRRPRRHEHLLLRGDRAAAARDRVRDRVSPGDPARGARPALGAQRCGARARGDGCVPPHGRPVARGGAGVRAGLCQRGAVRSLHRACAPHLPGARPARHRRPRRGDADRRGGDHSDRSGGGGASPARSGRRRRRHRRRRQLVRDPLRLRPARDGAPAPRHVLDDGVAAPGDGDGDRHRRAGADSERAADSRGGAGYGRGRDSPRP
jgi:hypothetical protein